MILKRLVRLTNTRVRMGVGLLLAVMFCIQCTRSQADRSTSGWMVSAVSGQAVGQVSDQRLDELERMARNDHIALLRQALENYRQGYQDYTCTFIKQERINGQLRRPETMKVRFIEKPFSVMMKWVKNPTRADSVLYVDGKNNEQMLVMPYGWLGKITGAVLRNPTSKDVLANTLRPVTMFGFKNSLQSLLDVYELAAKRGEGVDTFEGYKELDGRKVLVLKRVLPPRKDYPAAITTWYLDVEYLVPVGLEAEDWSNQYLCSYFYRDVKFNVGLSEDDFTPQANGMDTKKQ